jgi:hypothetical protein
VHDINTSLVDSANTTLENKIDFRLAKNAMNLDVKMTVFENLNEKENKKYEYVTPNIDFRNLLYSSDEFGSLNWQTRTFYKNYDSNKKNTMFVNDVFWNSGQHINNQGIVTEVEGNLKNTNYESENDGQYKSEHANHEIAGMFGITKSLPMQKEGKNFTKTLSPKIILRYAPGHMRDQSNSDIKLSNNNLFSLSKSPDIDVIQNGASIILGSDYKINDKETNLEKFSLSIGQVFRFDHNKDLPSISSLDQKMSDLVGEIKYNFGQNSLINYKFSLDHNFNDLNSNEISSKFNFGKVSFNVDYLE